LIAVTAIMKIKGTALRPGLTPPKIGKIYTTVKGYSQGYRGLGSRSTYDQDNQEQEKDVGNVVELEP
jgi:hypothetical protein